MGPRPLSAVLQLPRHPQVRDTYSVLHPFYWLSADAEVVEPVELKLADGTRLSTEIISPLTSYGNRRPMSEAELAPGPWLERLILNRPVSITLAGPAYQGSLTLRRPGNELASAGAVLRHHCP